MSRISRRRLILGLAALPGAFQLACSTDSDPSAPQSSAHEADPEAVPAATSTPEPPLIITAGEQEQMLMPGTPYETSLFIFGSGLPGEHVLVLGGVHGNEPGGWLAAEEIAATMRPAAGALLVIPRANIVATQLFQRTTDEMGDLNRSYPGDRNGRPMQVMAAEIIDVLKNYRVNLVLDLHESWGFFNNRTQNGTAFLGQTVTTSNGEPGVTIGRSITEAVNQRIQAPWEELFFRDRIGGGSGNPMAGGSSSLGLGRWVPGVSAILVEMGQQQELDRRVALHVDIVREAMRLLNLS